MSRGSRCSQNPESMDNVTKAQRSRIMGQVRGGQNKSTELVFIRLLREHSIHGWRRNFPLRGHPDLVFPKARLAVFLDGCFWHGCPLHCRMPTDNHAYWEQKIFGNVTRDRQVSWDLKQSGWSVIRFWEHDMKGGRAFTSKMNKLKRIVQDDKSSVRGKPRH